MNLPPISSWLRPLALACSVLLLPAAALAAPEIAVQQPAGANLLDGSASVTFPGQIVGIGSRTRVFTIRNTGPDPLTGLSVGVDGRDASEFSTTSLPASIVGGGSATLTVTFAPATVGLRIAALHILSNDTDEASFDINLTGQGVAVDAIAEAAYLKPGVTGEFDRFGVSVSISGNTAVIGSPGEDSAATGVNGNEADNSAEDSGAAYVFVRGSDGRWTRQAYLKASNTGSGDQFGNRVDIDGDTLVVGAGWEASSATGVNGDQADNSASSAGAAYVFTRTAGVWSQQAYLKAHNASELDSFGNAVAISGNRIVVGAQTADLEQGAAYVFVRSGSVWSQEANLKASTPGGLDLFGISVDISGNLIVVGAEGESSSATGLNGDQTDNSSINSGAAYIFRRSGSTWTQEAYVKASNTGGGDRFGCSAALSGDTVVVGAYQEDSNAIDGSNNLASASGAAYVFHYDTGTSTWGQQAYLKASNTGTGDQFGQSVAIEGDIIIVGAGGEGSNAPGVNGNQVDNSQASAGALYAYTRTGSVWSQQAYLKGPSPYTGEFLNTVAISQRTAVAGAFGEASSATGVNGDDSIPNALFLAGSAHVFNNLGFPLPVTISSASLFSDNTISTAHAKGGHTLTLAFTASDDLFGLPIVTLAGRAATVTDLGSRTYSATLLVDGTEVEGPVSFLIVSEDLTGNAVTANATTDGTSVTLDFTAPVITPVNIVSSNTTPTIAHIGDTLTLSFSSSEALGALPEVTLAGRAPVLAPGPVATLTVGPDFPPGGVGFAISVQDLAGNSASRTTTTDASSVAILLPEIAVEDAISNGLFDGQTVSFGLLPAGAFVAQQFTIRNTGDTPLSGIGLTLLGLHAAEYTVIETPAAVVNPGDSTTFAIQFEPTGTGPRAATLQISSNDGDETPFDLELTGTAVYALSATYTTGAEVALTTNANEPFFATGSTVSLTLDHAPATGAELRVIDNTGLDFITGTFTGLDQGQIVTLPYGGVSYSFVANYFGGDGNDLVLTWARTSLHAWGPNVLGQIGDGTLEDRNVPVAVKTSAALAGKTVIAVASGYVHSVALCSDGSLYSWGFNIIGQLGDGTYTDSLEPVPVKVTGTALEGKRPVAIAAGAAHTLVLCSDGTVVGWGDNEMGQLGDGIGAPSNEAVAVQVEDTPLEGRKVVGITAGAGHSLARCSDGSIVGWGMNIIGQLGTGDDSEPIALAPVPVLTLGTPLDGKQVKSIAAGTYSTVALCTDGTLVTWGDNLHGQLANSGVTEEYSFAPVPVLTAGTALQGKTVTAIAAGAAHVTALCSDGSIVGWGDNYLGQLADGTFGNEEGGSPPVAALVPGTALAGKTIVAIAAGSGYSLARASDGSLLSWGSNYYGELGNGDDEDSAIAVLVSRGSLAPEQRFTTVVSGPQAAHSLALVASPAQREIVFLGPDGSPLTPASSSVDFGLTVLGSSATRTFTLRNIGGTALEDLEATLSGPDAARFSLVSPLGSDTLAADGQLSFEIQFQPAVLGPHEATLTLASNDADEPAFVISLAGLAVGFIPPIPVGSTLGDAISGEGAPDTDGTSPIGRFDILRRGGFLAENGTLAFPGSLIVEAGPPDVTAGDSQGVWKQDASSLRLIARTGGFLPELPGCVFDYLPQVPAINAEGEVTLLASLRIGTGGVTNNDDTGIWSELGGVEMSLLFLEGDAILEDSSVEIGRFASGAYASATTSATTGEIAFSTTFRDAETDVLKLTDTAVIRGSVDEFSIYSEVVAREGTPAPGTASTFGNLAGSYTDPARMDPQGNLTFAALTLPGSKEGIWTQSLNDSLAKVFFAGETAPGTSGATFSRLQRPSAGSNGIIAFRAFLNADGDNTTNTRNDGIWRGEAANPASFQCILRRGDDSSVVSNLPGPALVGNLWGGWLTSGNQGAWKGWLDVDGNGTSTAPTDKHAIYADTSGSMQLIVTVGDAVPGVTGATFTGFDLPVVGGQEQLAFLGAITGGTTTAADNEGLWRQGANGGPLTLALRKGQTLTTTQGGKTIQKIDLPGSGQTDRRWEQPVMDSSGRILVYITFTDGSTTQLLIP